MQQDYRGTLYGAYVSSFKGQSATTADTVWWDHKYLPLLADLKREASILEIGCGDGALLAYLAGRGFSNAHGVDISPEQVALAQRRAGVRAECADALTSLAQHQADLAAIIAVDVLEHLTRAELLDLAKLTYESLVPGGRLVIQTANGAGLLPGQVIYGDLTHQTVFTPASLAQLLNQAGFSDLRFYETGPIPIRLRGKLNVALWSAIKAVASTVRHIETGKRQTIWTENFLCSAFKPG
jgi:2-polyprenyl-3-methyl-5-hydroxy-6-metoxy-1,4-benzoquinol methylase